MKKVTSVVTVGLFGLVASFGVAAAQSFPDHPISIMVNYGAGGATDYQLRVATIPAEKAEYFGQKTVVINKPGAGGRVGWNWFATQADTDGYTLGTYNVPSFIAQAITSKVQFSSDSFEPLANWGADPAVVIVSKDSQFDTIQQLVDYAEQNPGKATVSGGGLYNGHHVALLQLEKAADVKFAYIPTKGGAVASMAAVIGGTVIAGINNLSDAYRARESGNIKILAVADTQRDKEFISDVPTLQEAGYDVDDSSVNYRGLMAPKGTPPEVIDFLAERSVAMFQDKEVLEKMNAGGAPVRIMTRDEVLAMFKERQEFLAWLLREDLKNDQ